MLVTLLLERDAVGATGNPDANADVFEIERIEQIKGIPKGPGQQGNMGFFERLRIPVIENTAKEEDLTEALEKAMEVWPNTYAVLVRRHGIYVWGEASNVLLSLPDHANMTVGCGKGEDDM